MRVRAHAPARRSAAVVAAVFARASRPVAAAAALVTAASLLAVVGGTPSVALAATTNWHDTTYGTLGTAMGTTGHEMIDFSVDSAGRALELVLTDYDHAAVIRLTATGALDTTFGVGGTVPLPGLLTDIDYTTGSVVADTSDNVYVSGWEVPADEGAAPLAYDVVKFTPTGDLDTTFGTGGIRVVPMGGDGSLIYLYATPDGDVLARTYTPDNGDVLVKLTPTGTFATGFNGGGGLMTERVFGALTIDSAGRIVGSEVGCGTGNPGQTCLVRYPAAANRLDASFGSGGIAEGPTGTMSSSAAVSLQFGAVAQADDGYYYATGFTVLDPGLCGAGATECSAVYLTRFTPSGQWDSSWGDGGKVLALPAECSPLSMYVKPHGSTIWVGGGYGDTNCPAYHALVYKFSTSGAAVTTFGDRGALTDPAPAGYIDNDLFGFGLQPTGRPLLGEQLVGNATEAPAVVAIDASASVPMSAQGYLSVTPARVMDTRIGTGVRKGAVGQGQLVTLTLQDVPPGVEAVALNVTSTQGTAATSYVSVCPGGTALATCKKSSNLNTYKGKDIPNAVMVELGPHNTVSYYNNLGSVQLIADVQGYFVGAAFAGFTPFRAMDTRTGVGDGVRKGAVGAGGAVTLALSGAPAGAGAVVLNVTSTQGTAPSSYVSVCPGDIPLATCKKSSSLNTAAGKDIPNLVAAKLGTGNSVTFYNNTGSVQLIADAQGYLSTTSFKANTAPTRVMDTRTRINVPKGAVGAGGTVTLALSDVPAGAVAVVLNVTSTQGSAATSYVSVCPGGTALSKCKQASNLNTAAGRDVPNLVVVKLGTGNKVTFYNNAGSIQLIADAQGYLFGP